MSIFLEGKDPLAILDDLDKEHREEVAREVQEEMDYDGRDNKNEDSNLERED